MDPCQVIMRKRDVVGSQTPEKAPREPECHGLPVDPGAVAGAKSETNCVVISER